MTHRYGDAHPPFFVGPFKNAIDEAAGSSAQEVCTVVSGSLPPPLLSPTFDLV